jgi:hypothetical protein
MDKIKHLFKNNLDSNNKDSISEKSKTVVDTFTRFGTLESEECRASLEMYTIYLKRIESGHIVLKEELNDDQKEDLQREQNHIENINKKINNCQDEIKRREDLLIPNIDKQIDKKKTEYNELESKDPKDITITDEKFRPWVFNISVLGALLLTVFIYYFYVNLGYVLFDIPINIPPDYVFSCNPSVLNSLDQLLGKGGCHIDVSTGPLLLPILFLTIAILIHLKVENLLKLKKNKYKGYLSITLLILFVLILDTILAIKFEERLFNWEGTGGPFGAPFPKGLVEQLKYSYDESAFILILGLGFIAYIVWSLILHEISKEYEKKDPENVWRRMLRRMQKDIDSLNLEKSKMNEEKDVIFPGKIRELNNEIMAIRKNIKLIKIGGLSKLRQSLIEFTIGWNKYITFRFDSNECNNKIIDIKNSLEIFVTSSTILRGAKSINDAELSLSNK